VVNINDIFMKNGINPYSALGQTSNRLSAIKSNAPGGVYAKPVVKVGGKSFGVSDAQTQQSQMLGNGQAPTSSTPTNATPNSLGQNLLNFATSGRGGAFGEGVLAKSGNSLMPVSFSEALSSGMQSMNTYDANQATAQAQKDKFEYQKEQDLIKNQLELQKLIADANSPTDLMQNLMSMGIDPKSAEGQKIMIDYLTKSGLTVNTGNTDEANKGFFKTKGVDFGKSVNQIETTAVSADEDNQLLNRFEQLAQNVETGALAPFKQSLQGFAQALGISDDLTNLGALEALNSVSGRFVMQQVQKTKGAVSDKEMAYFFKISANIGNSGLGNQLIINMARSINDRAIAENNLLQNFLAEEYEKNPNADAYALDQKFKKVKEQFRKDNQLFTGDIEEEIKQYHKDNGLTYTGGVSDITKIEEKRTNDLSNFQNKYPNAKYKGETVNGQSQFIVVIDGKEETFEI
jgi:hypothetical protein